MCGCFSGNIRQTRQDFPLFAVLRVIVRDMAAMRAEPVISVRILDGWRAVRNGVLCPESTLFSARWNRLEKFQNRHIILSIVVKVCLQVRSWTQNAAIGELRTNCTGYWICNFVRTRAGPELPILLRISMSCATGPITS